MRRWLTGLAVGLLVGIGGLVLDASAPGAAFERSVGLPWLFHVRGTVTPPDEVVVVAIDGRTGDRLGLPALPRDWPRSVHGRLVDALVERGVSVIAFDVHFGRSENPDADRTFVDAVARAGNVVLVELLTGKRQPVTDQLGRHVGMVWAEELVPPFPALAEAARGLATFPLPKQGASVHAFWVFKESTDNAPTLPAVVLHLHARDAANALIERLRVTVPDEPDGPAVAEAARLRNLMRELRAAASASMPPPNGLIRNASDGPIGFDQALETLYAGAAHRLLNFYGPPGTIRTIPYHAVLQGEDPNVPAEALDLEGKAVFIGYSDLFDPGQPDRFYTVFTRDDGVDLSGVEIAATGFANLLTDRSLTSPEPWAAIALLLLFGTILGAAVYLLPGYLGVPVALAMVVAYAGLAQQLFDEWALVLPMATPLLAQAPVALLVGLLGQYLLERQRGQRISEAINYYLPADIARDLAQNRLDPGKLNQVVYSTCLATDMAGFSTIAERLPPGELARVLNDYFETLAAPLKKHGVHVTEFRADAIMCAWTADQPSAAPRRKALLAALQAAEAIKEFRQRHPIAQGRLRIGLEAGWVYVGHAGGGGRFVYSIVGDSANTASRVEGLNKHLGTQILATGDVVEGFENLVMRYLGAFQFVGKTGAIPVYEILATREAATDGQLRLCEAFDAAMAAYRERDWSSAAVRFEAILQEFTDDGPSSYFLARCRRFMSEPQHADDAAVIRMDAK